MSPHPGTPDVPPPTPLDSPTQSQLAMAQQTNSPTESQIARRDEQDREDVEDFYDKISINSDGHWRYRSPDEVEYFRRKRANWNIRMEQLRAAAGSDTEDDSSNGPSLWERAAKKEET